MGDLPVRTSTSTSTWLLVGRLSVLVTMFFGVILTQWLGDYLGWHLPWYFIHEVLLIAVPMLWLLVEVYPGMSPSDRLAFVFVSGLFIFLGSLFELVGIHLRFWWFIQTPDVLLGVNVGSVHLEEFVYYPAILNLSVLLYVYLQRFTVTAAPFAPWSRSVRLGVASVGWAAVALGVVLLGLAFFRTQPPLDPSIMPAPDAAGALRYDAGPPQHGWTILQVISAGVGLLVFARFHERLARAAFLLLLAIYLPYCFYLELMACGRGWWVWNGQQTMGVFTWVLPLDSYLMYLTGATLPVLVYELLRPVFSAPAPASAASP